MQNLRNPRQWEDGRKKSRKEEKGIDKRGRIWYSNKAVGESRGGDTENRKNRDFLKKVLDKAARM